MEAIADDPTELAQLRSELNGVQGEIGVLRRSTDNLRASVESCAKTDHLEETVGHLQATFLQEGIWRTGTTNAVSELRHALAIIKQGSDQIARQADALLRRHQSLLE